MTTYTQKLRASIAYNTDNYSLDCNVPGVPTLELCGPSKKPVKVEAIVLDNTGALVFYMVPNNWELPPSEAQCRTALDWINANFDKLFPEEKR